MVERAFAIVVLPEEVGPESARRKRGWVDSGVDEVDGLASGIVVDIMEVCVARIMRGRAFHSPLWR